MLVFNMGSWLASKGLKPPNAATPAPAPSRMISLRVIFMFYLLVL
jgi:hypothetical protein